MNFIDLIQGLGDLLGLELEIDKNRAVNLVLDGSLKMQIEFHSFKDSFCLVCPIEQLHQGIRREDVLKAALKSNHTFRPRSGQFGYVEKKGFLVLFMFIPVSIATVEGVFEQMVILSKQARSWQEALQSGLVAPQGAFEESTLSKTSIFGAFKKP
ncbi:MAG: hypothetical protein FJZ60_01995 [Chlamydiae bacterium]|nr:hypothetical protein [Chlamydiota bacterium]